MAELDRIIETLSLTMGAAWGSGINLYATLLVLGFLGMTESMTLPPGLEILSNPLVMGAAGLMYMVEFFADKVPGVDTGWDTIHTFVRIPAGALLAAGAVGEVSPSVTLAAAIVGGGMAAAAHGTKSGTRLMINASPEPVTNWTASFVEDAVVFAGVWAAVSHPEVYLAGVLVFILVLAWVLPKIWRAVKSFFSFFSRLFRKTEPSIRPE